MCVVSVYRDRNASTVLSMLEPAIQAGADIRLWALERGAPALGSWTLGRGPGGRFELVNRLLAREPLGGFLVVADDDVSFQSGNVVQAVALANRSDLDLSQPAHTFRSRTSHDVNVARLISAARRTTFVEIGPVVIASPRILPALLPFPEATRMGWGADIEWTDLERSGYRFGVLDAIRLCHPGAVAADYPGSTAERSALDRALSARGLSGEWQRTVTTIRPWKRRLTCY